MAAHASGPNVIGNWEHRFFGSSYLFTFDHRTPLTVWNVRVSRNITTYPQELAQPPAGTNVGSFLNSLYLSSIPDPGRTRSRRRRSSSAERGLPSTLAGPGHALRAADRPAGGGSPRRSASSACGTPSCSPCTTSRAKRITASGNSLPPRSSRWVNDNTQTGGSIVWTNRLTQAVNLIASITGSRTVATGSDADVETRQGYATMTLSAPLSGRMTGYVGARYQKANSDIAIDYNEAAAFVGISYTLR